MAETATTPAQTAEQEPRLDLPDNERQDVEDACSSPAWQIVSKLRIEQITRYGHTSDQDDMEPLFHLAKRARQYSHDATETLSLNASGDGLDKAYAKAARAAATNIALMDRITRTKRKLADRIGDPSSA